MREKHTSIASHMCLLQGPNPYLKSRALTRNRTSDLSLCRTLPNPLSHSSKGPNYNFKQSDQGRSGFLQESLFLFFCFSKLMSWEPAVFLGGCQVSTLSRHLAGVCLYLQQCSDPLLLGPQVPLCLHRPLPAARPRPGCSSASCGPRATARPTQALRTQPPGSTHGTPLPDG